MSNFALLKDYHVFLKFFGVILTDNNARRKFLIELFERNYFNHSFFSSYSDAKKSSSTFAADSI